jgi:hypothetical protein
MIEQVQACLQREPSHRPTAARLLAKLLHCLQPPPPVPQQHSKDSSTSKNPEPHLQHRYHRQRPMMQKQRPASVLSLARPVVADEMIRRPLQRDPDQASRNNVVAVAAVQSKESGVRASANPQLGQLPANNHRAECAVAQTNHACASSPSAATYANVEALPEHVTPSKVW